MDIEGITRCIKCHSIAAGIPNEKCIDCHKDIENLIAANRCHMEIYFALPDYLLKDEFTQLPHTA